MRKNLFINKIYKWILNEVFKEDTLNLKTWKVHFMFYIYLLSLIGRMYVPLLLWIDEIDTQHRNARHLLHS